MAATAREDPRRHVCETQGPLHRRRLQPQVLVSYKQGLLGTEDFFAPEHKAITNPSGKPMEIGSTLQDRSWGYHATNRNISPDEAWAKRIAARQGPANLLLNSGPMPDGSIPPVHAQALREMGARIRRDGFPAGGGLVERRCSDAHSRSPARERREPVGVGCRRANAQGARLLAREGPRSAPVG